MVSVVIVGSGNVATHLIDAFLQAENVHVKQVYSRNLNDIERLKTIVSTTNSLELLENADVTIVAVNDNSIGEVSALIKNSFVVHTSGNTELNALKNSTQKGVFYPLQSFSKEKKVNFSKVPFCLEANSEENLKLLESLVNAIGAKFYHVNSHQRKHLHVAAVFANNFSNHMYTIANDICKENNISFDILLPLIEETALKIKELSPVNSQTGPAVRNDKNTIQNHLTLLNDFQQKIYKTITESIQHYGEKL